MAECRQTVRMPLGQISSCGDRDDYAGARRAAARVYYPSRRHQPAALQALVDAIRV